MKERLPTAKNSLHTYLNLVDGAMAIGSTTPLFFSGDRFGKFTVQGGIKGSSSKMNESTYYYLLEYRKIHDWVPREEWLLALPQ